MRQPAERFPFSPIAARPRLDLPHGKRIAVYLIVNVEVWDFDKPVPRQYFGAPGGATVVPDVPNWSWHEYGMRVGFWRLLDSLNARGIKPSAAINAKVIDGGYEPVARAIRDAGWNFMGHGYHQKPLHLVEDQCGEITRIRRDFRLCRKANQGLARARSPRNTRHARSSGRRGLQVRSRLAH
jgi:allantoinase